MKLSRQIILATLMLGSIAGTASAMFQQQFPQFNMGNMFGQPQQPRRYMPQQRMFGQMPQRRQQFANPMMYSMMNQLGNTEQSGEYALAAFMNWMMNGQPYHLHQAISYSIKGVTSKYYPQKLKNIWWTRVIIDTVLARLTSKAVAKVMTWVTSQKAQEV